MGVNLKALKNVRVCIIDTSEFLAIAKVSDPALRCRYVGLMLRAMDYALEAMPWEYELQCNEYTDPTLEDQDVSCLYKQLTTSLWQLRYEGEPLIVSPSKGQWIILHFFKE